MAGPPLYLVLRKGPPFIQ